MPTSVRASGSMYMQVALVVLVGVSSLAMTSGKVPDRLQLDNENDNKLSDAAQSCIGHDHKRLHDMPRQGCALGEATTTT